MLAHPLQRISNLTVDVAWRHVHEPRGDLRQHPLELELIDNVVGGRITLI